MKKPVLVVMAAGMGSRYGGLKQIDPVGGHGQLIIDYSIYDAISAGFETIIFVIKREMKQIFEEGIGKRIGSRARVIYAFQELGDIPQGCAVPEGREKPWGTCHAVLAAREFVDGPFAVINADDYYGPEAFKKVFDYLSREHEGDRDELCMVGYLLGNTVTENGHVARGVCDSDEDGFLTRVTERTHIEKAGRDARFTEDGGESWQNISGESIVSMNFWGLSGSFMKSAWERFPAFLKNEAEADPLKAEYFLPSVISELISSGRARVRILRCGEKWYGVTYKADKPTVVAAIAEKTAAGEYPDELWKERT